MQLRSGTTLCNGRYEIISCIGDGGFGITYLARDARLDRDIVIKEYFPDFMAKRDVTVSNEVHTIDSNHSEDLHIGIAKFMKEAKTLALLNDIQAIATVHDFFEENNTAYIVMEYIKGKNLRQCIRERQVPYSFEEAITILEPCMQALQRVHEVGIIHRDFAPDNILINEKGRVKIIDFGSSRDYVTNNATMTIMVKHGYAPVEQYSSGVKQGPYTDVYSIGAILYEMLTLNKPITSIDRIISDKLPGPCEINPSVTKNQGKVVMKGLAVVAENRYQTVEEFYSAIKEVRNEKASDMNINSSVSAPSYVQSNSAQESNISNQGYFSSGNATELISSSIPNNNFGDSNSTEILSPINKSQQVSQQWQNGQYASNNNQSSMQYGQNNSQNSSQNNQGAFTSNYQGNYTQNNNSGSNKSKKLIIGIIAAAILAFIVIGVIIAKSLSDDGSSSSRKKTSNSNKTENNNDDNDAAIATDDQVATEVTEEPAKEDTQEDESKNDIATNEDLIKIGIVFTEPNDSEYSYRMYEDLQNTLTKENGYDAYYSCSLDKQMEAAYDFISQGVDYLVIRAYWSEGWDSILKEAKNAGIDVIIIDREIDADSSLYDAVIVSNMEIEGQKAVDWMLSQGKSNLKVINLQGVIGSAAQIGREKPLEDAERAGKCSIVWQYTAEWSAEYAEEAVTIAITSGCDFNVIYADNDDMALGAIEALDAAGITHGAYGEVMVIGFDFEKKSLEKVLSGEMNLDVQCSPFHGEYVDYVIKNGIKDGSTIIVEDRIFDTNTITKEDIEKYGL